MIPRVLAGLLALGLTPVAVLGVVSGVVVGSYAFGEAPDNKSVYLIVGAMYAVAGLALAWAALWLARFALSRQRD